eukprot:5997673-Lingulodinium_polyedra.AAC.2
MQLASVFSASELGWAAKAAERVERFIPQTRLEAAVGGARQLGPSSSVARPHIAEPVGYPAGRGACMCLLCCVVFVPVPAWCARARLKPGARARKLAGAWGWVGRPRPAAAVPATARLCWWASLAAAAALRHPW